MPNVAKVFSLPLALWAAIERAALERLVSPERVVIEALTRAFVPPRPPEHDDA